MARVADLRNGDKKGKTALMIAASFGNVGAMRALLESASYSTPMSSSSSAVATIGSHSAVEEDARDHHGKTALIWAAYMGKVDAVRELLSRNVDVEQADESGRTPLMWAGKKPCSTPGAKPSTLHPAPRNLGPKA